MRVKIITLLCLFLATIFQSEAQSTQACSTLGQTPASAFPVCTKDTFIQSTVPICTNKRLVIPGCGPATGDYADKNPFWYRFTCYQSGSLNFLITPNDLNDDYDWQLYDITGVTDLNAVYTNAALFVVGNWSGSSGLTGASRPQQQEDADWTILRREPRLMHVYIRKDAIQCVSLPH